MTRNYSSGQRKKALAEESVSKLAAAHVLSMETWQIDILVKSGDLEESDSGITAASILRYARRFQR